MWWFYSYKNIKREITVCNFVLYCLYLCVCYGMGYKKSNAICFIEMHKSMFLRISVNCLLFVAYVTNIIVLKHSPGKKQSVILIKSYSVYKIKVHFVFILTAKTYSYPYKLV